MIRWIVEVSKGRDLIHPVAWTLAVADGGWFVLTRQTLGDARDACELVCDTTTQYLLFARKGVIPAPIGVLSAVLADRLCPKTTHDALMTNARRAFAEAFDVAKRAAAERDLNDVRAMLAA